MKTIRIDRVYEGNEVETLILNGEKHESFGNPSIIVGGKRYKGAEAKAVHEAIILLADEKLEKINIEIDVVAWSVDSFEKTE